MLTYKNPTNNPKTTTLNDIPAGTVFYGEISQQPEYGTYIYKGVFLRTPQYPMQGITTLAIGLSVGHKGDASIPPIWTECVPVQNYRPLKNPKIVED